MTRVLSHLEFDPTLETAPLSLNERKKIETSLSQKFTFLGSGGQAYAFLSEDQTTVLKLFKHHHLQDFSFLSPLPLPFVHAFINKRQKLRTQLFQSCKIAYDELASETGLLYVQLNKKQHYWKQKVTLIDKLGISHQVDLNQLEFMLQKKASLAFSSIKKMVKEGDQISARQAIGSLLKMLADRCRKGIKDNDNGLKRNMGLNGTEAMSIDIGSFSKDPSLSLQAKMEQEIREKTWRLKNWLVKNDPELGQEYEKMIHLYVQKNSI